MARVIPMISELFRHPSARKISASRGGNASRLTASSVTTPADSVSSPAAATR